MTEERKSGKNITIEEAFRKVRPLFIMMMMFPLFGLIAAMILLYILKVKNLLLVEGLMFFALIIYVVTTYLAARKMGQMGKKQV
jgi:positive regulator of sigma E activity